MTPRAKQLTSALAGFIIVILVAAPEAQQQAPAFVPAGASVSAPPRGAADAPTDIDLLVGRSTILNVGTSITRVSLTVPEIADAMVTAPGQLLIHGKQPGTISLFVWDKGGAIKTYEVNVRRDLSRLVEQMKQLFPGESVTVTGSGKDVVISGTVSSKYVIDKAAEVAAGYVEKKEDVVNLLKQQEGMASNQVLLRVRFAEVSRNALQEVGASLFSDGFKNKFARTSTQQFAAPSFDQAKPTLGDTLVFSDYLNLFLFDAKNKLGAVVKALQTKGVFQSLAEPNLIALNGKEASFLAGGEFPYPIPQGNLGAVSIQFKEYGVRLTFTPTVLGGDLINLKIKPEVSSLDFNNAIVIQGFRIPALTTRRAETEVELRDGQTFAIAGLLNNSALSSTHKVPGLGDIPILGLLFKSRAYQKDQTELVVMVTPQIVRRDSTGVSEGLPALAEPFLPVPTSRIPTPAPYVGSPRGAAPASAPKGGTTMMSPPAPAPQPAPVTRPIQGEAALPRVSAVAPVAPVEQSAPVPTQAAPQTVQPAPPAQEPIVQPPPAPPKPTKAELKALEQQREAGKKAAEAAARQKVAEDKRNAEAAKVAQTKADDDKRAADKLAKERAIREAEVAKKNAEIARRKADEDQKRERALADAATRLKQAQAAYQAEIDKAKGGTSEKAKGPGKTAPAPDSRH